MIAKQKSANILRYVNLKTKINGYLTLNTDDIFNSS